MANKDYIFDITKLRFEGDFSSQVHQLLQFIRLTRAEVEHLQLLFDHLHDALQSVWPGCQVHAFGSIVTGLGIKSSDVDCFIRLPIWLQNPGDTYVAKAKAALMKHPNIFRELFAIKNAKVPIVKFYHVPTQRHCDISFKSPAGVENSKLLAFLLNLDNRVLPLAILIKYWAKVHKLTGTNLMPNYALTLLIIFYLQHKGILPSVLLLQRNAEYIVDNWNVAFEEVRHVSGNNESLYELLGGFFKYYRDFKYDVFLICPFLGRPIKRELFAKGGNVPPEFELYKTNLKGRNCLPLRSNSIVCIQDPFDHSRNCSIALYPRLVNKIMSCISKSADIYENEKSEIFLWGILSIAIEESPVVSKKRHVPNGVAKFKHNRNSKKAAQTFHKAFIKYKEKEREKMKRNLSNFSHNVRKH
ncbi:unnamed protein product [Parnassius apollo]|uniref:(apollo) hypothetical protein n=1 Tax=Parnassius apollo TaxID=110799 RepID=A0A8S3XN88_PARAO|nr:unnamed protein product [Parnassius apollo]